MGLPSTLYFLCFHYFGPAVAHSHFSTSYTAYGLLFLSFQAPLNPFTSSRSIFLSHGSVIHYSRCLGLMGFLLNLLTFFFSILVGFFLLLAPLTKVGINTTLIQRDCQWWWCVHPSLLHHSLSCFLEISYDLGLLHWYPFLYVCSNFYTYFFTFLQ